jgi:acyl carrier protein
VNDIRKVVDDLLLSLMEKRKTVAPGKHLVEDFGFDSMKMMEVMSTLEDRFGIVVPASDLARITTVADLYQVVEHRRTSSSAPAR